MSEIKHTPGPWEWQLPNGHAVSNEDEFGEWSHELDDYDVNDDDRAKVSTSRPIRADDRVIARLIAAAPELLEAAMLMQQRVAQFGVLTAHNMIELFAVIRKATQGD